MIDLDLIRIFLRVVERGGFTAASRQLGIPVSSVSRKVLTLEAQLGVRLLYRTTRRLAVTEVGQDFYTRCQQAEAIVDEAEQAARVIGEEAVGTLRVLLPYSLALNVLEPSLTEFRRRHPKVRLELTLNNALLDLVEHGFDIALHRGPPPESGYIARPLGRSVARLVASPAYLARANRPDRPSDLANHATLAIGRGGPTVWALRGPAGVTAEVTVTPIIASNESLMLVRQSVDGAGIALLSAHSTDQLVARGDLEIVLPGWSRSEDATLMAMYPAHATLDRKIRLFVEFCVEIFTQRPEFASG